MKRNRVDNNTDFVKDGYDNNKLYEIIQEVRNKYNINDEDINNEIKEKIEKEYDFFHSRYPFLFDMCLKKDMNFDTLKYMLNLRDNIVKNKISFDDASKKVGQDIYTQYQEKK